MSFGVCCQWLKPRIKRTGEIVYENSTGERGLQLGFYKKGRYTEDRIKEVYHANIDGLINLIPNLIQNNINLFRVSSNILPLFDFTGDIAYNDKSLHAKLKNLGTLFNDNSIRVTTHPGQFVVLSSDSDNVVENSIRDLEYHAWVFDMMGLSHTSYNAINIHGGKKDRSERLSSIINTLPHNIKSRLTLENDERCYSVRQLLDIQSKTNTPIVWDSHHHTFNQDNMTDIDAAQECMKTWESIKPLQHLSNSEPEHINAGFKDRRKHSWLIHYIPDAQKQLMDQVDIEVEAKGKNIAVLRMRKDFGYGH